MERKYYRKFDNFDKVIPRPEDFPPVYRAGDHIPENLPAIEKKESEVQGIFPSTNISLKADDIILLGLIVILLMEEQKDYLTIGLLAVVFLSEYLF